MTRTLKLLPVLFLAALVLLAFASSSASAEGPAVEAVRVYDDGLLTGRAYRSDEEIYLSAEELCAALDRPCGTLIDPSLGRVTLCAPGLELCAQRGQDYVVANGRYLYSTAHFIQVGGRVYFPLSVLEQIFSLEAEVSEDRSRVELDVSGASFLDGGEDYYPETYGSDELLWLSRIISAEAGDQPMAERISVGNVVLNRVASGSYPDTIREVVLDRQQSPLAGAAEESYLEPADAQSVVAACLCLEGCNLAGDSVVFESAGD